MVKSIGKKVATIDTRRGAPVTARITGEALQRIRKRILVRDMYTCCECGDVSTYLVIDHIVPLHLGGRETDENRQCLCVPCHEIKSAGEASDRARGG